ncbi:Hypothetical protein CAP_2261 [Chondromyces apiculatus DSM 436]|uniref:Uncharacterized protein n=1 Tax=Chondromyces apiculatus DSM 436 TaxID=1192034 RepID=A0A017TBW6_9BACT|nr:Hypothetical protein CAP_2261 [Chondromyces apiculatus DSM 436]
MQTIGAGGVLVIGAEQAAASRLERSRRSATRSAPLSSTS